MALSLPIDAVFEYRGLAPASEFAGRDGEKVEIGPRLKFEHETADGDVSLVPVPLGQIVEADPTIDASALKRGDRVHVVGEAVIQDPSARLQDGTPRRSYFRVRSVRRVDPGTGELVEELERAANGRPKVTAGK